MKIAPLLLLAGILGGDFARAYDSVVVFNEVHYHPVAGQQEFIELRNLQGVDVNLDGWSLSGGVDYTFPAGSVIPGHGYLVLGAIPGAAGAFSGSVDNGGETLRLRNRNRRIMDELTYDDSNGWPEGADGSGFTLTRIAADATSGPQAWTASLQPGGTPGEINFNPGATVARTLIPPASTWKYSAAVPPADWAALAFDDSAWTPGRAAFASGPPLAPVLPVTASLVERFRASSIAGVADGGTLTTWEDEALADGVAQSASAGTTTPTLRLQATPSGRAAVRFDGNDELRTSALPGIGPSSGFCYWMVVKANAAPLSGLVSNSSGAYLLDRQSSTSGSALVSLKAVGGGFGWQKRYDSGLGLGGPASASPISQTAFQIVALRRNRTTNRFELWVDGALESSDADTGSPLTPPGLNIGRYVSGTSTTGFNGDIAELLVYGSELSAADFAAVGAYLETAYGLDTAFPGTYPATAVAAAPTSFYRRAFHYPGTPALTTLRLDRTVADGAVFYLNGSELQRDNLPAGPLSPDAPALSAQNPPAPTGFLTVPAAALRTGTNVLAVSLHRAANSANTFFNAALEATELPDLAPNTQRLAFNEIAGSADPLFFVELKNDSPTPLDTTGWTLLKSSGLSVPLPARTLAPGALLALGAPELGFTPADGSKLFLLSPSGARLGDARSVTARLRGLTPAGDWGHPDAPTPGNPNPLTIKRDVVINEIFYHALQDGPEQWIELHNKGAAPADLSGWKLSDAVNFAFPPGTSVPAGGFLVVAWDPAAFAALHPGIPALGPWSGSLSGRGETITLRDPADNLANQVAYGTGGQWSAWPDGGGPSLELIDPQADNRNPGAWDSSDETLATPWKTYTYTGTGAHATTSTLTYFHEFIMGLLDSGEVLIDDISLKEVNSANRELIQNGSFTAGTAAAWRTIGTHRQCAVVDDPFSPGNPVLKIVATGATEHMNNQCVTTLKAGSTYVSTNTSSTYTLSFRAKWLRGSNRLHTRLYFNRLARQSLLPLPATGGTPGAINSRRRPNLGPTFDRATVQPTVPAIGAPAEVAVRVADPDGLAAVELFTSLNGAAFTSAPMSPSGDLYRAAVPPQVSGAKIQFYIKATDLAGASRFWPAAGPDSRAMIPWEDGKTILTMPTGARPHNIRVVMPGADANFLYQAENVQSNEYRPCTVILDDQRAWYEASTRLKSSEHGRFQQNRVGYNLKFGSDDPFLGAHETISIDRSGNRNTDGLDGTSVTSQREILIKAVTNAAGGVCAVEDDLIRVIPPLATGSPAPLFNGSGALGEAILSKSRFDSEYLDGQWDQGSQGPMFKQEYIYPLTETINPTTRARTAISASGNLNATAEQPKVPQTGGDPGPGGIAVQAYNPPTGTDPKENYRWHWLIRNARTDDDYRGLIAAVTSIGQSNSTTFRTQTAAALDTDAWMRAVVPAQLFGVVDNYLASTGSTHNFMLYFPPGGKGIAIPWDLDYLGQSDPNAGITNGGDITKFLADPASKRRYYGHVLDFLNRSFNDAFLTRWATHYSKFGVDDISSSLAFLRSRATYVRNLVTGASAPVPVVAFNRTSAATQNVATPFATVTGSGWIDIDFLRLADSPQPLAVTWTTQNAWSLQLPLFLGTRTYTIEAIRRDGTLAGSVATTVTSTSGIVPADSNNTVFSKIHYCPAPSTAAETSAGFPSPDDFEYFELQNISPNTIDLTNCRFSSGLTYAFASGTRIPSGGRLAVPRRSAAFALRFPGVPTAAEYFLSIDPTGNKLSDSGETLALLGASGLPIKSFSYDDKAPWPTSPSSQGSALVLLFPLENPAHGDPLSWRASAAPGGTPLAPEGAAFAGSEAADANQNSRPDLLDFALGAGQLPSATLSESGGARLFHFALERDWSVQMAWALELASDSAPSWAPAPEVVLESRTRLPGTVERLVYAVPAPLGATRAFLRARCSRP